LVSKLAAAVARVNACSTLAWEGETARLTPAKSCEIRPEKMRFARLYPFGVDNIRGPQMQSRTLEKMSSNPSSVVESLTRGGLPTWFDG
jgi:hypothetical protein